MLGCDNAVVEAVDWRQQPGPDGQLRLSVVAHVRPRARQAARCGICGKKRPGYDQGDGRRRWRAPDLGTVRCELEADAPRVSCPQHGIVTVAVPWARHGAGHTRFFDDQVAWLAAVCSKLRRR
jgi:transposase